MLTLTQEDIYDRLFENLIELIQNLYKWMELIKLGNIVSIHKGKKLEENNCSKESIRYIQIEDLRNNLNLKYVVSNDKIVACSTSDILIAWDGANAGTVGFGLKGAIGSTIAKLSPTTDYFTPYVGHFLQSRSKELREKCTGATIPHISKAYLTGLKIPLPPLAEQKRIAAMLDKADALRQKNKQLLAAYDELLQATFLEMFGDPVTNPKGWETLTVSDFAKTRLGKMLDKKKIEGNNLKPYLRNSNVLWFVFKLDDLLEMDFHEKDQQEFSLKTGDILMCEGGEIGRCAIWKEERKDIYFQKAIHRIRLDKKLILPEYFVRMFRLYTMIGGLNRFLGAATILHLTGVNLKKMILPIPPIELQNKFSQIVENIEAQKTLVKKSLQDSEDLFGTLVQKAFSATKE